MPAVGHGFRNRVVCMGALAVMPLVVLSSVSANGPARHIVPRESVGLALPPLAVPDIDEDLERLGTGSGRLAGTMETARRDFAKCLQAQGWSEERTIALEGAPRRLEVQVWIRAEQRLSLQLWQDGAGQCMFLWGIEDKQTTKE